MPEKALDCGSLLPLSRSQPAGPAPPKLASTQHAFLTSPHAPHPTRPSPTKPGIARLRTRATQQALAPTEPERRRLWTAGSITALRAHGVRAARSPKKPPPYKSFSEHAPKWKRRPAAYLPTSPPSDQARDREAPYSRHPTRPLPTSLPSVTAAVTLDCGSLLPLSRSQPAGPAPLKPSPNKPPPSDQARDREAPYSRHPTRPRPLRTSPWER
jgi:hypothetical protein